MSNGEASVTMNGHSIDKDAKETASVSTSTTPASNSTSSTTTENPNGGQSSSSSSSSSLSSTSQRPRPSNKTPSWRVDNPMPHLLPEGENATPLEVMGQTLSSGASSDKLVLIMVGLPATGKTHIAKRICRFLSFFHDIPSQIFNVGDYRRRLFGAQQPAEFYSPDNPAGSAARNEACNAALDDLIRYMQQDSNGGAEAGAASSTNPIEGSPPRGRGRGGEARVAAFDATNTTQARRHMVIETLKKAGVNCKTMFVESICDQEGLLEENIRKVKLATPDYRGMDPETAVQDFRLRRANYMQVYEPVKESEGPSIKIINSRQFIVTDIRGYLPLKVVHFLMNLHTLPRTFYLTRHGQSHYNLLGKIGGDSGLTPNGIEYAKRLAKFCQEYIAVDRTSNPGNEEEDGNDTHNPEKKPESTVPGAVHNETTSTATTTTSDVTGLVRNHGPPSGTGPDVQPKPGAGNETNPTAKVDTDNNHHAVEAAHPAAPALPKRPARLWTSTLRRTKETAQFIKHNTIHHTWDNGDSGDWVQFRPMERRNLDELYAGTCDGMTYKEIEQVFPEEFRRRQEDKLTYRYPRGESYMDVTLRLEPLAQEMERTREPVLIIGHQGILRILYAYFMGLDRKDAPYVSIPLNYVIELSPHAYGCHEHRYCLMHKEEMIKQDDGQDEPITSMPMLASTETATATPMTVTRGSSTSSVYSTIVTNFVSTTSSTSTPSTTTLPAPNDPVLNAPSH